MIGSKINFILGDGTTDMFINDQTSINTGFATGDGYYIQVQQVDGLYGADISYESDPLPNVPGEISGDVIRRGKGLTLSGQIWANGLSNLDAGSQFLQSVFWDTSLRKLLWWPLNRDNTDDTQRVYVQARVNNDLVISQALSNLNFSNSSYPWTVGLRCDDPRIYNQSDASVWYPWQT